MRTTVGGGTSSNHPPEMRCFLVFAAVLYVLGAPAGWGLAASAPVQETVESPQDAPAQDTADAGASEGAPNAAGRQEAQQAVQAGGPVVRARIADEPITPVTVRYLRRVFEEAVERGASAVLIEMDTPGGLVQSTREIVKSFLGSPVPVIVYVTPAGSRAASAGVFITVAAHVAAMTPGTHIGAAHPVQMGPGQADTTGGAVDEKVLNDTRAWARSLADLRGRNADWVERAVTESESIVAEAALELNVIDLLAASADDLLDRIDGREVDLGNRTVTLRTAEAEVVPIDPWWGERLLGALANPNVAFILLILGFYGLLFEFYSPGWGVAGTLGALFLLLGFTGMSVLPINVIGLLLIFAGLGLLVAEAFVPSFGVLTMGGVGCLILGGVMLVDSPPGILDLSTEVLVPVAVATGLIAFFLMGQVVRAHRKPTQTGAESMIGADVEVVEDFTAAPDVHAEAQAAGGAEEDAEMGVEEGGLEKARKAAGGQHAEAGAVDEPAFSGLVRTHGELWRARSAEPLRAGERARIASRDGLTLFVRRDD